MTGRRRDERHRQERLEEVLAEESGVAHRTERTAEVRGTVVAAFCIGETISGRIFRAAFKAANVPLARDVVAAIVSDETFHAELGWELGALLMRKDAQSDDEQRAALASELPRLFRHYAQLCCATGGPAWARRERAVDDGANFGTLTDAGYAREFFAGMENDVLPGLVALGLAEAEAAYAALLAELASP